MVKFVPALELARLYFEEVIQPILDESYPDLVYSAGRLGPGSEVLGFDNEMSTDHDWGLKVTIYVTEEAQEQVGLAIEETMSWRLPFIFRGWPTQLIPQPDGDLPKVATEYPIRHHQVRVLNLFRVVQEATGIDLEQGVRLLDWLVVPEQELLGFTRGIDLHDDLGVLAEMRRQLAYYPHDVWLYLLSAQWARIGQEEPFVGRTGIVDDEIGSAVLGARLVRDLMRLAFLLERQYAPYPKWFGTAFSRLEGAANLAPHLEGVLRAAGWQERERYLNAACEQLAARHNALAISKPGPEQVTQFYSRPFHVIQGETIARLTWQSIEDDAVRALPFGVGKAEQWVDSVDVLSFPARFRRLQALYEEPQEGAVAGSDGASLES